MGANTIVEDLLKPRWKVIADYPKSLYHVGDILNAGWRSEDLIYCDHDGPRWRDYPHLFRKLEWWEDRKPEDMPEYVKLEGKYYKPVDFSNYLGGTFYIKSTNGMSKKSFPLKDSLPVTESEYLAYNQQQSSNQLNK